MSSIEESLPCTDMYEPCEVECGERDAYRASVESPSPEIISNKMALTSFLLFALISCTALELEAARKSHNVYVTLAVCVYSGKQGRKGQACLLGLGLTYVDFQRSQR